MRSLTRTTAAAAALLATGAAALALAAAPAGATPPDGDDEGRHHPIVSEWSCSLQAFVDDQGVTRFWYDQASDPAPDRLVQLFAHNGYTAGETAGEGHRHELIWMESLADETFSTPVALTLGGTYEVHYAGDWYPLAVLVEARQACTPGTTTTTAPTTTTTEAEQTTTTSTPETTTTVEQTTTTTEATTTTTAPGGTGGASPDLDCPGATGPDANPLSSQAEAQAILNAGLALHALDPGIDPDPHDLDRDSNGVACDEPLIPTAVLDSSISLGGGGQVTRAGTLPNTGSTTTRALQLAGLLLSAGGLVTLATRRHRTLA